MKPFASQFIGAPWSYAPHHEPLVARQCMPVRSLDAALCASLEEFVGDDLGDRPKGSNKRRAYDVQRKPMHSHEC